LAVNTKILIIEDDPGIRRSLALSLKTEGYAVVEAPNGRVGLELAAAEAPALIICDVNMPEMDGYAVVAALRRTSALASIPFVFLTARGERSEVRRGMNLGADDYLTKPFTREELIDTVKVRLQKHQDSREALTEQLILASERMRSRFFSRLTGEAQQAPVDDTLQADAANQVTEATVLFTDIRGFTTISERLSVVEIATLLNHYFQRACEPIVAASGQVVKFIGDGIMAVFPHSDDQPRERQALRAIQAGLALSLVAHQFREWVHAQFPDRGLPEFAIGVGIHTGEVTLCDVGAPGQHNFTAIGDTVNIASRLEGQTKELGWPVVASGAAISAAGDAVIHGAHRVVHLRGRTKPVLVYQVVGLKGLAAPSGATNDLSQQLRQALAGNAEGAAVAVKAALRDTLLALLTDTRAPSMSAPMRIKNYAVIAKLNQSSGSALYLAERDADGKKMAIRIRQRRGNRESAFQRFIEQATTVGRLDHPNVAPIFDHGFADDVAYIVTEYFPRGPLKQALSIPVPPRQALAMLRQATAALVEVHRLCVLSDDIQPKNVMVRDNGDIALAELDCWTDAGSADEGSGAVDSLHYRAPERVLGGRGDQRSDIYSLGVIFYEMLAGKLPHAGTTEEILKRPVPRLGTGLASYQELLDRMLAKDPAHRFADAATALQALAIYGPAS
jgi:serine/threonine-protein kinase PpkA